MSNVANDASVSVATDSVQTSLSSSGAIGGGANNSPHKLSLPSIEQLTKELEALVEIAEQEYHEQKAKLKGLADSQLLLQQELRVADEEEKALATKLELMRQNINDRKRKESELSKNASDLKERYKTSTIELKKRQEEFQSLDNERKSLVELLHKLSEEITDFEQRKRDAIQLQKVKKREFAEKTKLLADTRQSYQLEVLELAQEVAKWEGIVDTIIEENEAEAEELQKHSQTLNVVLDKIEERSSDIRSEYIDLVNQRDSEVGAISFNPVYEDFYQIVEEIHVTQKKIEMKRHVEDFLTQMISDLFENNSEFIAEKKLEEESYAKSQEQETPRTERNRSTILGRKRTGNQTTPRTPKSRSIYGTVESFMLKKTKAEYDLLCKINEVTEDIAKEVLVNTPKQDPLPEIPDVQFRSEIGNSPQLANLVEIMKMRKMNQFADGALSAVIEQLSHELKVPIQDIMQELAVETVFDDYYIDYDQRVSQMDIDKIVLENELHNLEVLLNQTRPPQKENTEVRKATRLDVAAKITPDTRTTSRIHNPTEVLKDLLQSVVEEQTECDVIDVQRRSLHAKLHAIKMFKAQLTHNAFVSKEQRDMLLNKSITGFQSVDSSQYHYEARIDPSESTRVSLSTSAEYVHKTKLLDNLYEGSRFFQLTEDGYETVMIKADENASDLILHRKNGKRAMKLHTITDVVPGHRSRLFIKNGKREREHLAFSITTSTETIDLELYESGSEEELSAKRDAWVRVILIASSLAKSVH